MSDELPEGWASGHLGDLVDILDGRRIPVNSDERAKRPGNVPYYGATGQVGWIDDQLFDEELVLLGEDGAPFLDKSKPIAYLIRGKSWVNNHAHVLRARSSTSNMFVKLALDATRFDEFVNGTTRLKLTQGAMVAIPLPVPPLPEQRRIVEAVEALLEQVNQAKERLDRVPLILKRFRQAVLAAACSGELTREWRDAHGVSPWPELSFGHLIESGPQNGLYKPQSAYGSGLPIVRIDDFHDGRLLRPWADLRRLSVTAEERRSYGLKDGDLLINRVNSPKFVGKPLLVQGLRGDAVFESNMMRVSLDQGRIDPSFALLFLLSPQGRAELQRNAKHAVNQSSINQGDVREVACALPGVDEQTEIVRQVDRLLALADAIEHRVRAATSRAGKLPQAILSKAFSGELVPTEADLARAEGRTYETAEELLARVRTEAQVESGGEPTHIGRARRAGHRAATRAR